MREYLQVIFTIFYFLDLISFIQLGNSYLDVISSFHLT